MSEDLANLIRREAAGPSNARAPNRFGIVTSYNKTTYAVKVTIQPEGIETGWIPLGSTAIGNGFGIVMGAKAGDLVQLSFIDGDHSTPTIVGRFFSDKQRAPEVEGGEFMLRHESGTRHHFAKDGSHTQTHAKDGTVTWDADGNHGTDLKGKSKTLMAGSVATQADSVTDDTPRRVVTGTVHLATGRMTA